MYGIMHIWTTRTSPAGRGRGGIINGIGWLSAVSLNVGEVYALSNRQAVALRHTQSHTH